MAGYLIRRALQMSLVVMLSTLAIYILLNVAPGGPLSGLRIAGGNRREQVSEAQIRRLQAYLGIDKPILLRYVAWLIGDDWMGADWMSLELKGYELPDGDRVRFWSDPGLALIEPGYVIWAHGSPDEEGVVQATHIDVAPQGNRPVGVIGGAVLEIDGQRLTIEHAPGDLRQADLNPETTFAFEDAQWRPEGGSWLDLRGITGANGLLGNWAGFHGDKRGVLRLDLGTSWRIATGQPVMELVKSRLGNTLWLMGLTTVVSLALALPIGIYSAVKQYSRADYAATTFTFFGSSMPIFWFGLMAILFFSYSFNNWNLPFFPAGGVISFRAPPDGSLLALLDATPEGVTDRAVHLILPVIVLSLLFMAQWSRFMRSSMLEVKRQDYVRTARAKGLRERTVIAKHALRNALIPVITVVVLQLPNLFGGAILTETVFAYPGMGRLYFQALGASDWPVVMILLFITAVLVVVATLLGDIIYTVADPRIRFS